MFTRRWSWLEGTVCSRFPTLMHTGITGIEEYLFFCVCPCGVTFTWWGCCSLCLWHESTELAHSFLFCSCVYFCLYDPFNCISFHKFSRHLADFSLLSSGLISALLVLSTVYLFMKVSLIWWLVEWITRRLTEVFFSPDIIFLGWLGSKHQLSNWLTDQLTK